MDAIPYLLQTSVLLLVLSIGYYLLLRHETFFQANRLLLWSMLVGAFLLPLIELPDFRPERVRSFESQIRASALVKGFKSRIAPTPRRAPLYNLPPGNEPEVQLGEVEVPAQPFPWATLLGSLYCLVAGILFLRLLIQLHSLRKLIDRSVHTEYDDFILVTNDAVQSPFSFFNWVVLNPTHHTPDEQEQIMRHERVHVRQRHSLDTLAAELLCIFCWFNPGAWLFRQMVHQTLEFIADRAVLAEGVDARAYQYNLLKVTLSANSPTISNQFSRSELKTRIQMMNKRSSSWSAWAKYPLLVVLVLAIATAFIQPKAVRQPIQALKQLRVLAQQQLTVKEEPAKPIIAVSASTASTVLAELPSSLTVRQIQPETAPAVTEQPPADTVRVSSSRYLQYAGDRLYWLVTPMTKLEDFAIIKQELAKYNYIFQLIEVKYDPLYNHITRAEILVRFPKGGNTHSYIGQQTSFSPITSRGGYVNITPGISAGGTINAQSLATSLFSNTLEQTATAEEAAADVFFKSHQADYKAEEGQELRKQFNGLSYSILTKNVCLPNIIATGFEVKSDGTFILTDASRWYNVPFFLDNQPFDKDALSKLKIDELDRFILVGPNYSSQKAVFLYTKN